jgi:DNA-binding LacI/PurR family transcriptional regulator
MSVTQKQIAQRLNISPSLVGRALSGHPEVAAKTRLRVAEVAREMGYSATANSAARALIAKRYGQHLRKGIVALAFPPLDVGSPRHLPFFAPIMEGMEMEAARLGIELYSCVLRDNGLPQLVREQGVDGLILLGSSFTGIEAVGEARKLDIPVLTIHWRCDGAYSISPDDREGARQATRYLVEQGHRRIGFLGVEGMTRPYRLDTPEKMRPQDFAGLASIERLQGYLTAMGECGLPVQEEWIEDSLPLKTQAGAYCSGCGGCASCSGWAALQSHNGEGQGSRHSAVTALICHNDSVAMGTVIQAQKAGFDVPGDLSVIGFDNLSQEFNFQPVLTSVDFPRYRIGEHAVELMHQISALPATEQQETAEWHRVFPAELKIGASTQAIECGEDSVSSP